MTDPDRPTAGDLVRHYREGLRLTRNGLAGRTTTLASDYIKKIEDGQRIGRRSVAITLTRVLEMDPWQTDEFLYVAGHAPLLDWQQVTRELLTELGHGGSFIDLTTPYYRGVGDFTLQEDEIHGRSAEIDTAPAGAAPTL